MLMVHTKWWSTLNKTSATTGISSNVDIFCCLKITDFPLSTHSNVLMSFYLLYYHASFHSDSSRPFWNTTADSFSNINSLTHSLKRSPIYSTCSIHKQFSVFCDVRWWYILATLHISNTSGLPESHYQKWWVQETTVTIFLSELTKKKVKKVE